MPGYSDFQSQANLNSALGLIPLVAANPSRFLACYTTAPTGGSGSGSTEVNTGGGTLYARAQFAGQITVNGSTATSSPTLHVASVPAWLAALGTGAGGNGVTVWGISGTSAGLSVGTVSACVSAGTTITLSGNAANAVGATDVLAFSAFPLAAASSGTEPAVTPVTSTLGAQINFAQSGAAWGTVTAVGSYDAVTAGNFYLWDYLNLSGAGKWVPFTCTLASPGVITCLDVTFVNTNNFVVASKIGGTLPTLSGGSWAGVLTVAGVAGSTFYVTGNNTSSTGDGLLRIVTPVVMGATPTTLQFPASSIIVAGA